MRLILLGLMAAVFLLAQGGNRAEAPKGPATPTEPGIPVMDPLVKAKCGGCHRSDEKGQMTRISWERTTPEGWQEIIKRMVRLNGLSLTPEEARNIVASLSESHGLAPEEFKPVAWFAERRTKHTEGIANEALRDACASCHPLARPQSWRRSKEEWELLVAMHRGYFPVVEMTSFRRPQAPPTSTQAPARPTLGGGGGATARGGEAGPAVLPMNNPQEDPAELAVREFSKTNGLFSPEWASWQAARRELKITGRWLVKAWLPGKGRYVGEMAITAAGPNSFTTKTSLTHVKSGEKVVREGRAVVYTGYSWRGRSKAGQTEEKEVMAFSRDQMSAEGRWFWGGYDEFGYDVQLERAGAPLLLTTDVTGLKRGATATVKIYGEGFPAKVAPADLDFGGGVKVTAVTSSPGMLSATVTVEPGAIIGLRDLTMGRNVLPGAVAVYDKVDYLKVQESAIARLGGNTHPKGFVQFESFAWSNGQDGKKDTGDDFAIMAVAAQYAMEEFPSHLGDDDAEYVGSLSADGLFTPSIEGPNERRKFGTNNYGDVWVSASWTPEGSQQKLTAKSYLLVAVPLYVRWDSAGGFN